DTHDNAIGTASTSAQVGAVSLRDDGFLLVDGITAIAVTLRSDGEILMLSSADGIVADRLLLQGGKAILTAAPSDVNVLAADLSDGLGFLDAGDLIVGTVGGTNGITAASVNLDAGSALELQKGITAGDVTLR